MEIARLYIGNVSLEIDDRTFVEELNDKLSDVGVTVHRMRIIKDKETGRLRGFAFIDVLRDQADVTIRALDKALIGGRNIYAEMASKQPERSPEHERQRELEENWREERRRR